MCPRTAIYMASYYCNAGHSTRRPSSYYYICVLILLCVSSYCYIWALILLHMRSGSAGQSSSRLCRVDPGILLFFFLKKIQKKGQCWAKLQQTTQWIQVFFFRYVLILLYMCPHTTIYVPSFCNKCPHTAICVYILLYMCPHTTICVSSEA